MTEEKPAAATSETAPAQQPPPPATRKGRRWVWVVVIGLVVLGGLLILQHTLGGAAQASRTKTASGPPPVQVTTAVVRKGDVGIFVNALGAVTPLNTVMIRSRVDGQLMTVNYVEGQMVHAGDSLVEIDPRPYQAQLTQTEGQLARDQALLENARVDLERYQIAFSKNAIPKQQFDTQVATVHQYEGAVKLDQGQVDNANLQLTYAHITAPISGRVGLRPVDAGNIVHTTDTNPLAVITQLQPITVIFSVAEDYLPEIREQLLQGRTMAVEAFDRAQQKKLATGALLTLDNQIDTTTGTVRLKGLFTNEDNALFPNQFVNARLLVSTEHDATLVPTPTIQRNAQGPFVYLVQTNQTVAMRPVTLGATDGNVTAVQGLEPGEIIAADNFNRLQEGAKVVPRKLAAETGQKGGRSTNVAEGGSTGP
jgi:multidrug efflux system membrane fusion protein